MATYDKLNWKETYEMKLNELYEMTFEMEAYESLCRSSL